LNPRQLFALIGSVTTMIGVFSPLIDMPLMGSVNAFHNGRSLGAAIFILGVVSLLLSLAKKYLGLWLTGVGVLGITIYLFVEEQLHISHLKEQIAGNMDGNPFQGLANMAADSIQLDWGWAMLLVGGLFILAGAAMEGGVGELMRFCKKRN